jgi:cysteine desulfurase
MHINNEIGVIQPIEDIGKICKKNNIIFHVDAAQSLGKKSIDVNNLKVDLLSISSHKVYGPKGIGALFIKNNNKFDLQPIKFGGGHEKNLNPGSLAVPNIVGFGRACEILEQVMISEVSRITKLRDRLLRGITKKIIVNGSLVHRAAGNLNITIPNKNNEALIASMPEISISTGSACTSRNIEPSHVLMALGLSKKEVFSTLRIGIGRFNNENDIEIAINCLNRSIN